MSNHVDGSEEIEIYHMILKSEWDAQSGDKVDYAPSSFATEGFLHLSRKSQVTRVANTFFQKILGTDMVLQLLCVDPRLFGEELRWEAPIHPTNYDVDVERLEKIPVDLSFPHLYKPLPKSSITRILPLRVIDGRFELPAELA